MVISKRKVNKPRVTLRKELSPAPLHLRYRGIIPFLIFSGADMSNFDGHHPIAVYQVVAQFIANQNMHLALSGKQLTQLRQYLRKHNLVDWTKKEKTSEAPKHRKTPKAAGRRANPRKR